MRQIAYIAALGALAAPAPCAAAPPQFVGAMLDGPAIETSFGRERLAHELDVMRASGVGTVRVAWRWAVVQPHASWAAVPVSERARFTDVDGLPLAIEPLDELVSLAAARGLRVLPVTLEAPPWIVRRLLVLASPPRSVAPYARFVAALVKRYGPSGSFWRANPRLRRVPIRWWQLWNEPHLARYWAAPRWEEGYARLVRAGARAVHQADRDARVLLAGMTSDDRAVWDNLDDILAEGVGPQVDAIAAHVFTGRPADVVRALRRVRGVMSDYGLQRMPLALTEWSFPSSRGTPRRRYSPWETTERGQAQKVRETLRRLARARRALRLETAVYYTWLGSEQGSDAFTWAGLRRAEPSGEIVAKPALAALRAVALPLLRSAARRSSRRPPPSE